MKKEPQKVALKKITAAVYDKKLDLPFFSKEKEKKGEAWKFWLSNLVIGLPFLIGAGYLAWESSLFYLTDGNAGADLLPIGPKSVNMQIAGPSCFGINSSLSFYFLCLTALKAREGYLSIKLKNELEVDPQLGKKIFLLLFAGGYSAVASYVFYVLSTVEDSVKNEIMTAAVNAVLNFFGAYKLGELGWSFLETLCLRCCHKGGAIGNIEKLAEGRATLVEKMALNIETKKSRVTQHWVNDSQTYYISDDEDSTPLNNEDNKSTVFIVDRAQLLYEFLIEKQELVANTTSSSIQFSDHEDTNATNCFPNTLKMLFHLFTQTCNLVAVYGYFFDTTDAVSHKFSLTSPIAKYGAGGAIFLPFYSLTIKLVYDTSKDIINLLPNRNKNAPRKKCKDITCREITSSVLRAIFSLVLVYFSYESSSTSLDLNRKHGLQALWSIIFTSISTTMFNGFGAQEILKGIFNYANQFCLFAKDDRDMINNGEKVQDFVETLPTKIEVIEENESSTDLQF